MNSKITVVLLALVVISGCLSSVQAPSSENTSIDETVKTTNVEETNGYLVVETVREVPANATIVNAGDERIRNVTLVQQTVENVTAADENASVDVSGEQLRQIQSSLAELPWYDGRDAPNGNYVRKDDTVVRVYLKVLT